MYRLDTLRTNRWLCWLPKIVATSVGMMLSALAVAAVSFPNVPLQSGLATPANLFFLLDDSGSMQWEVMPDQNLYFAYYLFPPPASLYGGTMYAYQVPGFDDNNLHNFYSRSPTNNAVFYNPTVTYIPWARADGTSYGDANPTAAPFNPSNSAAGTINLTARNSGYALWFTNPYNTDHTQAYVYTTDDGGYHSRNYYPITFYIYKGSGSVDDRDNYHRYQIRGSNAYVKDLDGGSESSVTAFSWPGGITRTVAQERQNFANWFSYYRSRILAARAGASLAFSGLGSDFRVGFRTINGAGEYRIPVSGLFTGTNKQTFFDRLLQTTINTNGTPLRTGLQWVGEYYAETSDTGPWGPAPQLECRQSFAIVTTDGFWNGAEPTAVGNEDGSNGSTITNADGASYQYTPVNPYQDSHSATLADVAMAYWKTDLRPDLANKVRPTSADPAFWQHMSTFGLSIGVAGTLDPSSDLPALESGAKSWPDPFSGSANRRIDDLWHATINGRGSFVAAADAGEFADGLQSALSTITDRVASASNVTANTTSLQTSSQVFQARFTSGQWTGELVAFDVTTSGVASTPSWSASQGIPAPNQRRIMTWNDSSAQGAEFVWNQLSSAQQSALGSSAVLDYLRGNRSGEQTFGGSYRNRNSVLGDIIHSSPTYVPDTDTLIVGANDGMLHGFDASNGQEVFAYVPSTVYSRLADLSDPAYDHAYYVDGEVVVSTRSQTPSQNIAVASLGRGGKALVGLDVTTPSSFAASDVLWELTHADLGHVVGKPFIAKVNNGDTAVIVGNGYNSADERAKLLVIDITDGSIIASIDTGAGSAADTNGLSTPKGWDEDGDGTVDTVYAGDLLGNLWKFDLSASNPSQWEPSFKQGRTYEPFFIAQDSNGNRQPITSGVAIGLNPRGGATAGQRFVLFGTGRYLTAADQSSVAVNTWYGLRDDGSQVGGRSDLRARSITVDTTAFGQSVRAFGRATAGDMTGKDGWYLDMVPPNGVPLGERFVSDPTLLSTVLVGSSIIPSTASCAVGGTGFINAIDAFTGASVDSVFFDLDRNNHFDASDLLEDASGDKLPAGSIDLGIGLTTEAVILGRWLVAGGSSGSLGSVPINNPTVTGRVSWHEVPPE